MYEVKSEAHEFVGAERAEAIEKACQFFEVEADELSISGFDSGAVYGLAARTVIVAIPKNRRSSAPSGDDGPRREEGGREGGRGRERGRGRDRNGGRDRDGKRSRDGGRDRDGNRSRGRQSAAPRQDRPEPRRAESAQAPESEQIERSDKPSIGSVVGEIGEID